jgi:hypothetical protein
MVSIGEIAVEVVNKLLEQKVKEAERRGCPCWGNLIK